MTSAPLRPSTSGAAQAFRTADDAAAAARDRFLAWLVDHAYPLWWGVGADHLGFGFFERIDGAGRAVRGDRRARVLGRQIFAFAQAARLGWAGPATDAVRHGLRALPLFLRDDGLVRSLVSDEGRPIEGAPDLYDQAFVLFGLAAALPHAEDPAALVRIAAGVRTGLRRDLAHIGGGYEEASPRALPLRANPHMHLLEAGLAWAAADGRPDGAAWDAFADEIAELALARFIDPATGALHEFFDGDWNRMTDPAWAVVEPGHQFEWGWLLLRWGALRGRADATAAGLRLIDLAERHGVDQGRGVTFGELHPDLSPRDLSARLWSQTERIKAWALAGETGDAAAARSRVADSIDALFLYLRQDLPGSWRDRMLADGSLVDEPAPASSLYHIVCAAAELADRT